MTLSIQTPYQIVFTQIIATSASTGNRIFLRDQGGSLWEFSYDITGSGAGGWLSSIGLGGGAGQPTLKNWTTSFEGYGNYIPWGSKRSGELKQILVDSERSTLYGLTRDNKLQRWTLGGNGALTPKGNALNVLVEAGKGTMGHGLFDASKGVQVVRMDLVEQREASVSLILTTSNGARIYFKDPGQPTYGPAPTTLYPCHVRLPPYANNNNPIPVTSKIVTDSRYLHGVHITIHDELRHEKMGMRTVSETMWYTPDLYEWAGIASRPQQQPFQGYPEVASLVNLDTQIQDMGEEQDFWNSRPVAIKNLQRDQYRNMSPTMRDTHEFITETTVPESRRRIVVLTNNSVLLLEKVRPVDQVEHLLASGQAKADVMIAIQRSLSTAPHALLAIDLAIAAQNSTNGNGNGIRVKDYLPGPSAQAALDHFVGWSQDLEKQKKMYEHSGAESAQSRQNALMLQLARMLRTVGYTRILTSNPATNAISSAIPVSLLHSIQTQLEGLKSLLDGRNDIFSSPGRGYGSQITAVSAATDPYAAPRLLLDDMIQAIAFTILISEFRLDAVVPRCDPGLQQSLFNMTYYSLVTEERSRDAAKRLVTAVVDLQISQEQSIELISDKLQDRCPSFCSKADVELYKAMESLRKAKEVPAGPERSMRLDMALNNFVEAAPGLSDEKLREVCGDFCSLNFAAGCIILPVQKAEREDSEHLSYGYWMDGANASDPRKAAFDQRKKYYDLAFMALKKFDADAAEGGPASPSAATKRLAYEYALGSVDELFVMCLFDWYIEQGRAEELLRLDDTLKVQHFLQHRGLSADHPDLLWRFFALNGKHAAAAHALHQLAQSDVDIPFPQRVEALTSALMQAKSAGVTDADRVSVDLITTLEAETEVASVQLEVWKALADDDRLPTLGEEARTRLCQTLLDISELYEKYAVAYDLHECRLLILQTADHRDVEESVSTWESLFAKVNEKAETYSAETQYLPWREIVVRLGKRFYPSHAAFPTDSIIHALYDQGIALPKCPEGWVTKALEDAGVSYQDIWVGSKDFREQENDNEAQQYIDREVAQLLPKWIDASKKGQAPPFFPGVTGYLDARLSKLDRASQTARVYLRAKDEIAGILHNSRAH